MPRLLVNVLNLILVLILLILCINYKLLPQCRRPQIAATRARRWASSTRRSTANCSRSTAYNGQTGAYRRFALRAVCRINLGLKINHVNSPCIQGGKKKRSLRQMPIENYRFLGSPTWCQSGVAFIAWDKANPPPAFDFGDVDDLYVLAIPPVYYFRAPRPLLLSRLPPVRNDPQRRCQSGGHSCENELFQLLRRNVRDNQHEVAFT